MIWGLEERMLGTFNQHVPMILFEPTCATSWWSLMHHILSVKEIRSINVYKHL